MSGADALVPGSRYSVPPQGIAATSWPRVASTCKNIGWRFDPWQVAVGRLILAKRAGGAWAANLSVLSIPRQVGKSYLLGCIIFALCLLHPKLRVIWTSHHTATTEEMYEAMKELAEHKRVKPHVLKCVALQGSRWRIQFRNGSRIDFGARSQGFGRGKANVGILVLDEFQHITPRALTNLTPTTNTAANPLILCAGTPPGPDVPGEAFAQRRRAALEGISDDTLYVEFSADPDADSDDRKQWAKANPSFPKRTGERAFLLQRKMLDDPDFRRDMLGIWDQHTHVSVITRPRWDALEAKGELPDVAPAALGIDATPDGRFYAAGCWLDGDDAHVELLPLPGELTAMADLLAARCGRRVPVLIHSTSPAKPLVPLLQARRVVVKLTAGPDMATAAGLLFEKRDGAYVARFTHGGQKPLTDGVQKARAKPYGDAGAWVWDFTTEGVSPVIAATLARLGASSKAKQRTGKAVFV